MKTKIITCLNQKGGVGKTTNTVHIASYYASQGKKVLLIDADNQCDLTSSFGLTPEEFNRGIVDFLEGRTSDLEPKSKQPNLYVISGSKDFESSKYKSETMKKQIHSVFGRDYFDYIFIDVPPTGINDYHVVPAELALVASDYFICTVYADKLSMKNLNTFLGKVFKLRDSKNKDLKFLGVHFSNVNTQKKLFETYFEYLKKEGKGILFNSYIRSDAEVEKACFVGETIFQYNPNCRAAEDYILLAEEIKEKIESFKN